jgi:hypothetical protein
MNSLTQRRQGAKAGRQNSFVCFAYLGDFVGRLTDEIVLAFQGFLHGFSACKANGAFSVG